RDHFFRRRFQIEQALVDEHHALHPRDLCVQARLGDDFARRIELQQKRLFRLVNRVETRQREQQNHDRDDAAGKEHGPVHCPPPSALEALGTAAGGAVTVTFSVAFLPRACGGRYGMIFFAAFSSTMTLLIGASRRDMVSRYMRLRVTSGAFLYSS